MDSNQTVFLVYVLSFNLDSFNYYNILIIKLYCLFLEKN